MRLLGIDFGDKYIGIAISDELCKIATPLDTILSDGSEITKITELIKKYNISKIIIGNPLNMDGSISKGTEKVNEFIKKLSSIITIPIELRDERLTTKEIQSRMIELDLSRKKRKKKIDSLSACLILQSYIDNHYEI
jgi:putative Holliday junction resolvase